MSLLAQLDKQALRFSTNTSVCRHLILNLTAWFIFTFIQLRKALSVFYSNFKKTYSLTLNVYLAAVCSGKKILFAQLFWYLIYYCVLSTSHLLIISVTHISFLYLVETAIVDCLFHVVGRKEGGLCVCMCVIQRWRSVRGPIWRVDGKHVYGREYHNIPHMGDYWVRDGVTMVSRAQTEFSYSVIWCNVIEHKISLK